MDGTLTYSKRADLTGKLIDLFKAVIRNGLKMSPRKCKLFKKSLVFMGLTMMVEDDMAKNETSQIKNRGNTSNMSIFLPSLQEKLVPIYFITRKGVPFYWGEEQQKVFDSIYSKKLPEAVERYSISELELT